MNRLRDALRAYHRFGRDPVDGRRYNWKDVSEAISVSTDVDVPAERLRQFVEGIRRPDGGRRFLTMQDDRLEAIVKFATHEDNALITEAELREHAPSWHAAQRLLEYLKQAFDTVRILPPSTIEGTYRSNRWEPPYTNQQDFVVRDLTLQRASEDGLIHIVQTEDFYDDTAMVLFDEWSQQERDEERNSRVTYGGWAILTPEDNLLMFLKNERNGRNCYYLTVASDFLHASQSPLGRLALLRHDYPLELELEQVEERYDEVGRKQFSAMLEAVGDNIMLFKRIA
ncbi:MAG: hypothetical protein WBX11_04890 [Thiobacillaceae bacterium]